MTDETSDRCPHPLAVMRLVRLVDGDGEPVRPEPIDLLGLPTVTLDITFCDPEDLPPPRSQAYWRARRLWLRWRFRAESVSLAVGVAGVLSMAAWPAPSLRWLPVLGVPLGLALQHRRIRSPW